ncbi:SDR family oxidoreductase [Massilia sp. TWR1-2-2]|uniref:SDR family oxidoreductase n=1 Tax=Massilia sp. TWR1-2-2 TaxID=2804584 RepID=UPI003CF4898F
MMKAILTGHSKGLGAAIAADLLARGVAVHGIARGAAPQLAARFPDLLRQTELDLADSAVLGAWLAGPALAASLAGCDTVLLINNAGTVQPVGPLALQDAGAVARAIAVNVAAPLMLAGAVAAACAPHAACRILHVSSGAGRSAYPGWSVYCATKAALDQHARAVALDQNSNLRICSLAPGVIDTGMQAEIRATGLDRFPLRQRFDELKRAGELAAPARCAAALIDYLLADRFGNLPVDDLRNSGA